MMLRRTGSKALLIMAGIVGGVCSLLPRIPQPRSYHRFADRRRVLGIPNFWNVVSNAPFAMAGVRGWRAAGQEATPRWRRGEGLERLPYAGVCVGMVLTAFGSAYYHLRPNHARLVWDRCAMAVVIQSLVAGVVAERFDRRVGLWGWPVLVLVGIGSVVSWYASERRGKGDLRWYGAVQVYAGLVLMLALLVRARRIRDRDLVGVLGLYGLSKVFEALDKPIFKLGRVASGHTLKHLAAAAAGDWGLRMLERGAE